MNIEDLFKSHLGAPEGESPDGPFSTALWRACNEQDPMWCAHQLDRAAHQYPTARGWRLAGYSLAHAGDFMAASDRLNRSLPGTQDPVAVYETIAGCLVGAGHEAEGFHWSRRSDRVDWADIGEHYSSDVAW